MSESKLPRGLRNNNPLNIRRSGDKWQGLRVLQEDREFFQFSEMKWGWRAAFRLLCHTYYGKYKLRTIRDIITRWAPPKENNTEAYIRRVTDRIGIGPDKELGDPQTHPTQWMMIGIAMAIVENGTTNLDYLSMLKGYEMAMEP
jgi:hypothetical protein